MFTQKTFDVIVLFLSLILAVVVSCKVETSTYAISGTSLLIYSTHFETNEKDTMNLSLDIRHEPAVE